MRRRRRERNRKRWEREREEDGELEKHVKEEAAGEVEQLFVNLVWK